MSTDDKDTACATEKAVKIEDVEQEQRDTCFNEICEKKRQKPQRKVAFPDDEHIVTQYFEPANPWHDVPSLTRAQLAAEYLECCRRHNTAPIDSVLQQIRELPETAIGGGNRAARLTLSECSLQGSAPADALEALLRRVQFRRLEIDHAIIDDEGAEALFDMVEYYESAVAVTVSGPRTFGVRGWQAVNRMIKKSCQLAELEITNHPLESNHAPVISRALHAFSCKLRVLCLQRTLLAGDPLLCLVIALKTNNSIRELRLGDNQLTVSDAAQLALLLRYNTRLQLLDLSNNQIQDAGAGHIAEALAEQASHTPTSANNSPMSPHQCPLSGYETRGLAFLVLWNNQLTRNCANHLNKALSSKSLCVLNIGRNALGGETVRALGSCGALVSLGLQAARLGPSAARALADLIRADHKLQRLDLRDNKLGEQGLQAILQALSDNSSLTQIDLDEPTDTSNLSVDDGEAATVARLTREIRALCRKNEPAASSPERRVHRKISLTCHSTCIPRAMSSCEERRALPARLRSPLPSPAPSPAGSPVPALHSRFSVTRVTPERESSTESSSPTTPTRPSYSPTSRFRVVQVAEPPKIHVHTVEPRRSRFSVTRNYDSTYNPTLSSDSSASSPASGTSSPAPELPGYDLGLVKNNNDHTSDTRRHNNEKSSTFTATNEENATGAKDKAADTTICSSTESLTSAQRNHGTKDLHVSVSDVNAKNDITTSVKNKLSNIDDNIISVKENLPSVNDNLSSVNDSARTYHDKQEQLSHKAFVDTVSGEPVLKTTTKLLKNSTEVNVGEKVEVKVDVTIKTELNLDKTAKVHNDQNVKHVDEIHKDGEAMRQIEAITEDLGNLIQEMQDLSTKTAVFKKDSVKVRNDSTQTIGIDIGIEKIDTLKTVPAIDIRDNVVLKKNKSESSLDSPDLEVSRLMNKNLVGSPFCDSNSSLEISGSSMESLNLEQTQNSKPIIVQGSVVSDRELDRRKTATALSTESSIESNTSEITPVNSAYLNTSVSSTESVSPLFGKTKKIHDSLSSLEASVSSMDSKQVMVTSADSGIEYSIQHPEMDSSNEGTLTNNSSLKEVKKSDIQQHTLTSPKRVSSLLDVPALKSKSIDRMRKISWVAPSPSCHLQKPEPEKQETKLPSHLEKLLSLFQHPTSLFSRSTSNEEEKKSASNTPPRKDSSLTSSFWSWATEKENEKEEKDDSSETTDSTLSERIQVSFVDESFSKKLDSKTPSTDTENTLSEFQSIQGNSDSELTDRVTKTTDEVQIDISSCDNTACDNSDLRKEENDIGDTKKMDDTEKIEDFKEIRPRTFAAVLKSSGSENSLEKQTTPEGQPVDKLPSKVIRGIKENISPENTLTSSMTNTKTLAMELCDRQIKNPIVNAVWELTTPLLDSRDDMKAPIATIEETCEVPMVYDDIKFIDEKNLSTDSGVTSLEGTNDDKRFEIKETLENVDLGKDALSYLIYENQDFEPDADNVADIKTEQSSLAQELKEAEIKEKLLDLSPELVIDEAIEVPVFLKDLKRTSPVIPERAKLKKANSLEDLPSEKENPKIKTIAFKIPETTPRDIPDRRPKLRSRSGSSPKSLPESLNKPCPLMKMEGKKKKKVSSLGKMARDSLLALNMSEEELNEFRRSYKLTSVESLRSLESVSEDACSQSGTSIDSRCRSCLRTSQESLMSLDSITEDCKCTDIDKEKAGRSVR